MCPDLLPKRDQRMVLLCHILNYMIDRFLVIFFNQEVCSESYIKIGGGNKEILAYILLFQV